MINVPENKIDKRHPFPSDMLISLYDNLFSTDNKIAGTVLVKNADIVAIAEELRKYGLEIASWTCGTDRYDSYSRMSAKYGEMAGLSEDFEMIEVKRGDEDISATKVRNCLLDDDKRGFMSMVPDGPNKDELYNILKEQIEKVYFSSNESLIQRVARLERLIRR